MAFTWVDTETGDKHYSYHPSGIWNECGCTATWTRARKGRKSVRRKGDHYGIPCIIDRLIDNKAYRRKYRNLIQDGQGKYLLAAAEFVLDRLAKKRIDDPERYFASICAKDIWEKWTKPNLRRRGLVARFELHSKELLPDITAEDRFRAKVDWQKHPEACSLWKGGTDRDGYPRFWIGGKEIRAHRWWWEFQHGPIPAMMDIDHTCANRKCMKHLALKPHRVNRSRTENPGKAETQRTQLINELVRDDKESRACYAAMCEGYVIGFNLVNGKQVHVCAEHKSTRYEFVGRTVPADKMPNQTINLTDWDGKDPMDHHAGKPSAAGSTGPVTTKTRRTVMGEPTRTGNSSVAGNTTAVKDEKTTRPGNSSSPGNSAKAGNTPTRGDHPTAGVQEGPLYNVGSTRPAETSAVAGASTHRSAASSSTGKPWPRSAVLVSPSSSGRIIRASNQPQRDKS
jgi:hypothetical protein